MPRPADPTASLSRHIAILNDRLLNLDEARESERRAQHAKVDTKVDAKWDALREAWKDDRKRAVEAKEAALQKLAG